MYSTQSACILLSLWFLKFNWLYSNSSMKLITKLILFILQFLIIVSASIPYLSLFSYSPCSVFNIFLILIFMVLLLSCFTNSVNVSNTQVFWYISSYCFAVNFLLITNCLYVLIYNYFWISFFALFSINILPFTHNFVLGSIYGYNSYIFSPIILNIIAHLLS